MKKVFASRPLRGALIVLVTLICYLPAFRAGLIWDDVELFAENPLMREPGGLVKIWAGSETPDYFPVTMTSFWLESRIWGEHRAGYHALNILLHACSAVLLWLILLRLGVPGAYFAALIFAVHPVGVASVAWISERKNTLSLFFCFVALWCWLRHEDQGKKSSASLLLALAAFLVALLSKTSVVMLPVVFVMLAWWRNGRITKSDWLRAAPFFAASLLLGIVTISYQHNEAVGVPHEPWALRVARLGWVAGFYVWKLAWPFKLCLVYPFVNIDTASPSAWLPMLLLAGFFVMLALLRKTWGRHVLLGAGYFVVMLVPVSGIIWMNFLKQSWVADWWHYPAMPGLIALFAAGCAWSLQAWGRFLFLPGAAIIACLGILTWQEAGTYQSLEINCRHTLARNPRAWGIRSNLARELVSQGRMEEAVELYREGLRLDPQDMVTLDNLARTLVSAGRWEEALPYCREVVELNPNYAAGHVSLAVALLRLKHYDEADAEFSKAVNLQPGRIDYRLKLIRSLAMGGHLDAAEHEAQNTLRAVQLTGQRNGMDELATLMAGITAARQKRGTIPQPAER